MAIDTAGRRLSMMDMGGVATMPGIPIADGTFDAADRLHLLWLYSGISAGEATVTVTTPTSKGWISDHAHPTWERRKKRVDDAQDDLVRAYEDATGITAERERQEAIRELKRAAATALSVAKAENDPELEAKAAQIVALNKQRLKAEAYLERAGEIVARLQAQDDDDMQAFMMMARLV